MGVQYETDQLRGQISAIAGERDAVISELSHPETMKAVLQAIGYGSRAASTSTSSRKGTPDDVEVAAKHLAEILTETASNAIREARRQRQSGYTTSDSSSSSGSTGAASTNAAGVNNSSLGPISRLASTAEKLRATVGTGVTLPPLPDFSSGSPGAATGAAAGIAAQAAKEINININNQAPEDSTSSSTAAVKMLPTRGLV